jgi:uncharacterized OsmC-like protein
MVTDSDSAADDVLVEERIQPIHVSTEYLGRYQSINRIRDIAEFHCDEPEDLGGKNAGPTALEMTLAALNSCTAMIMHVMRKELRFDLRSVRFEADGFIDVRRVEMKRTGKKYSEIEPITYHYDRVVQRVYIQTSESDERLAEFREEVERLCPMHALLRDARVPMEAVWSRE